MALYFSILNVAKAATGFSNDIPLDEAVSSTAINVVAVLACAAITWNDYQAGEKNLERIAQGGRLAKLVVSPATAPSKRRTLTEYRRGNRVAICVGGEQYVQTLARSLSADQRADENTLAAQIDAVDLVVVPALVDSTGAVNDASACWRSTTADEGDRNFDLERSAAVVAFPRGPQAWETYLKQELETARSQGFDPVEKGLVIVVKKNGRVLRRLTGQPPWSSLVGTMEVADGSKFGMPGDDERLKGRGPLDGMTGEGMNDGRSATMTRYRARRWGSRRNATFGQDQLVSLQSGGQRQFRIVRSRGLARVRFARRRRVARQPSGGHARRAFDSASPVGRTSRSKIASGTASVATAFGTSTMPEMRPSQGQHDRSR